MRVAISLRFAGNWMRSAGVRGCGERSVDGDMWFLVSQVAVCDLAKKLRTHVY